LRVGLDGDVERRVLGVARGDGAGNLLAVMAHQRRHSQAGVLRWSVARIGLGIEPRLAQPAQHGIDQAGEMARVAVTARDLHGHVDGRMGRHAHEQDLGRGDDEDFAGMAGFRRQRFGEEACQQMLDLAQPAQARGGEGAHESPVALRQLGRSPWPALRAKASSSGSRRRSTPAIR
jgi:hypothetical protein